MNFLTCRGKGEQKFCASEIFRFFDNQNRDISSNVDLIASATTVTLTFKYQKKDVRNETISHQRSGDSLGNREMCPVRAAVETVKRLRSFNIPQEKLIDTPINYIEIGGKGFSISSSLILLKIRQAVSQLGHSALGFSANKVDMHSNRSGGAMGMFLSGTPVYTIMLMGR